MSTMEAQKTDQIEKQAIVPDMASCLKTKRDNATFLEGVKDHYDDFIHASMDERKSCFRQTIQKMFGMSEAIAETSAETKEIESSLHRWTVVADF